MWNKKLVLPGILIGILVVFVFSYNYFFPEHRQIDKEEVRYLLTTEDLFYGMKDSEGRIKYADQVIQTEGVITEYDATSVTLDNRLEIQFMKIPEKGFRKGLNIKIKGRCVGYDELLDRVKIDQAIEVN